jgi:porphobilinogen synthase
MQKGADDVNGPVIRAINIFRKEFPQLLVACDLCICPYTSHGHCGILDGGKIDNLASINRLAAVALKYATAGAHSNYFLAK